MKYYLIGVNETRDAEFLEKIKRMGFKLENTRGLKEKTVWSMEFDNTSYKIYILPHEHFGITNKIIELNYASKIDGLYEQLLLRDMKKNEDDIERDVEVSNDPQNRIYMLNDEQYKAYIRQFNRAKTNIPPLLEALGSALEQQYKNEILNRSDRAFVTREIFQWLEREQEKVFEINFSGFFSEWKNEWVRIKVAHKEHGCVYYQACKNALSALENKNNVNSYLMHCLHEVYEFLIKFYDENETMDDEFIEKYYDKSIKAHWILDFLDKYLALDTQIAKNLGYNMVYLKPTLFVDCYTQPVDLNQNRYKVNFCTANSTGKPWFYFVDSAEESINREYRAYKYCCLSIAEVQQLQQQDSWREGYHLRVLKKTISEFNKNKIDIFYLDETETTLGYEITNKSNVKIKNIPFDPIQHASIIGKIKILLDARVKFVLDTMLKKEILAILRAAGHTRDEDVVGQFEINPNERVVELEPEDATSNNDSTNAQKSQKKPALQINCEGIFKALENPQTIAELQDKITGVLTNTLGVDMLQKEVVIEKKESADHYDVTLVPKEIDSTNASVSIDPTPIMQLYDEKIVIPEGWRDALRESLDIVEPSVEEKATQKAKELIAMVRMALDAFVTTKTKTAAHHFGKKENDYRIPIKLSGNNHRMLRLMQVLVSAETDLIPNLDASNAPEFDNEPPNTKALEESQALRTAINAIFKAEAETKNNDSNNANQSPKECYSKYLKVVLFKPSAVSKNDVVHNSSNQLVKVV